MIRAGTVFFFLSILFTPNIFAQFCGTHVNEDDFQNAKLRNLKHQWMLENGLTEFRGMMVFQIQAYMIELDEKMRLQRIQQLYEAVDGMNDVFAGAQIAFNVHSTIEVIRNPQFFDFHKDNEGLLTAQYSSKNMINLYLVNSIRMPQYEENVAGYAYMPGGPDRLIISMPHLTDGTTLIHEMGHFFGLMHTHGPAFKSDEKVDGSNCATAGDLICDTPADPNIFGKVNRFCEYTGNIKDANGLLYQPMVNNFMSYAPSTCCNTFTHGQLDVLSYHAQFVRNYLGKVQSEEMLAGTAQELFERGVRSNDSRQQILWYTRTIQTDRYFAEAYYNRAAAYININEPVLALRDANDFLELKRTYKGFLLRGDINKMLSQKEQALDDYETALFLNPRSTKAEQMISMLKEDKPSAVVVAVAESPNAKSLESLFASAYATSNIQERINYFSAALEMDTNNAPAFANRSLALLQIGRHEEALRDIQQAISLFKHKSFYHTRGLIHHAMQNYRQAVQDFDNALVMDPGYDEAKKSRQQTIRTMETRRVTENTISNTPR